MSEPDIDYDEGFSDESDHNNEEYEVIHKEGKIDFRKNKAGAPKGNQNAKKRSLNPPPNDSTVRGGNNPNFSSKKQKKEKKEKTAPMYQGFMLTFRPFSAPYFENFQDQKSKTDEIILEIYKHDNIVRCDANCEKKLFRRVLCDIPWIHSHVQFTFFKEKCLTYHEILVFCSQYDHIFSQYDVKPTVGKAEAYKHQLQYIYKDTDIHPPWCYTKDELEYGQKYLEKHMTPKLTFEKEPLITALYTKSDDDRYKTTCVLICLFALQFNLVYSKKYSCLIDPTNSKLYTSDEIIEEYSKHTYMFEYMCLKKYMDLIMITHSNIYMNKNFIIST